ncbi:hypothetical protein D3C73_956130 [compost metagenome]
MVESEQHQTYIRHAIEAADKAILIAQEAEHHLQAALTEADPQYIQSAQAALVHARKQVEDANAQLQTFDNETYGQQIQQTLQQLAQSGQDLQFSEEKSHMPKQVR